jgi:succinate dehydrogenase/fumarate reductase cytochrome b subunit
MTRLPTLAMLVVVAHWIIAVWHLFRAAKILSAPSNNVSWLALILISLLHSVVLPVRFS